MHAWVVLAALAVLFATWRYVMTSMAYRRARAEKSVGYGYEQRFRLAAISATINDSESFFRRESDPHLERLRRAVMRDFIIFSLAGLFLVISPALAGI